MITFRLFVAQCICFCIFPTLQWTVQQLGKTLLGVARVVKVTRRAARNQLCSQSTRLGTLWKDTYERTAIPWLSHHVIETASGVIRSSLALFIVGRVILLEP